MGYLIATACSYREDAVEVKEEEVKKKEDQIVS